jgi:hypothetical protein
VKQLGTRQDCRSRKKPQERRFELRTNTILRSVRFWILTFKMPSSLKKSGSWNNQCRKRAPSPLRLDLGALLCHCRLRKTPLCPFLPISQQTNSTKQQKTLDMTTPQLQTFPDCGQGSGMIADVQQCSA